MNQAVPASQDDESGAEVLSPNFGEDAPTKKRAQPVTLVPTRMSELEAAFSATPTNAEDMPAPVYLAASRPGGGSSVNGRRVMAVFLGSMGLTTAVVLSGYGALLLAGGGLRSVEPIMVHTPIPFAVMTEVPVPVPVAAAPVDDVEEGLADDADVPLATALAGEYAPRPAPRPARTEPVSAPITTSSAVIAEPSEPAAAPTPAPAPAAAAPAPAPAPTEGTAEAPAKAAPPHPMDGAYGGKADGEAIQLNLRFRPDGTVTADVVRPGGVRSAASGTYNNKRSDSVSFIIVEGRGQDRISYSGSASDGKASGRIIQSGRTIGRFSVAQ